MGLHRGKESSLLSGPKDTPIPNLQKAVPLLRAPSASSPQLCIPFSLFLAASALTKLLLSLQSLTDSPGHVQSAGHAQSTFSLCSELFLTPLTVLSLNKTVTKQWRSRVGSLFTAPTSPADNSQGQSFSLHLMFTSPLPPNFLDTGWKKRGGRFSFPLLDAMPAYHFKTRGTFLSFCLLLCFLSLFSSIQKQEHIYWA